MFSQKAPTVLDEAQINEKLLSGHNEISSMKQSIQAANFLVKGDADEKG